jgi:CubicO group peptidase (beta-lactamase class C family)
MADNIGSTFARLLVATILLALAAGPAESALLDNAKGVGWASFRDLTSSEFAEKFDEYRAAGYIMLDVDAYPNGSGLRYSMVWQKNTDGRGWAEHRNLTSAGYHDKWEHYRNLGYRPLDVEGYLAGGNLRFAGIWVENVENLGWSSRRNMTGAQYAEYFQEQRALGRRPIDIEVYPTASGLRYAAIWYENRSHVEWAALRNMTRSQYQQEVTARADDGFRVVDFESYPTSGGQRYAAIWEKNPAGRGWVVRSDRTKLAFANLWRRYRDMGYRLVDFERYPTSDGDRYAGLWVENDSRFDYPRKGEIDDLITGYRSANDLPGISVSVIRDGKVIYRRGFGWADVAAGKEAHGETVYNAASVSKLIGGTLAAKLEDEGQLRDGTSVSVDLTRRTARYLTNIPIGGGNLDTIPSQHTHQVDHLLAHISCVAHYSTNPSIANQTTHYETAVDAVRSIWDTGLVSNCTVGLGVGGTASRYSTPAFTFVAAVLERATGRDIERLVRQEIFERYGLRSMRVQWATTSLPANYDRAVPYTNANDATTYSDSSWKVLGGGIETHVVDLAAFGWKVLNGNIVAPTARDNRMWTPVRAGCGSSIGGACQYGLAWQLVNTGGRRVAQWNGTWTGARAYLGAWRDDGLVIAIMSNRTNHTSGGDVTGLAASIATAVLAP